MINKIFTEYEIFDIVKKIAQDKGIYKEEIKLAADQYIETAEWMISRYHIKRMELETLFPNSELHLYSKIYH